jgi:hypothetical protein
MVSLDRFGLGPRQQDGRKDASRAAGRGGVGEARLDEGNELAKELHELGVVEPHSGHVVASSVAERIDAFPRQVAVGVPDQAGNESEEGLAVLVGRHLRDFVPTDPCRGGTEDISALDRAADASLADDAEHPGINEHRNVPIEAARRDIGKLTPKLSRRQRPVAKECLHDPQPDRMQEQVSTGHAPSLPFNHKSVIVPIDGIIHQTGSHPQMRPALVAAVPLLLLAALGAATLVARRRGYRLGSNTIVRCRQGHLFTTIWIPGVKFKALDFGVARLQRCPVGNHWSLVTPVRDSDLTDEERNFARAHHDVRIP